ncbi:Cu(2+)-transporting P-type ATPase [Elasticomyces elasticus]|nr:Cu(2+)-transporting P-type ATPase [Elasticomyces elasticus]
MTTTTLRVGGMTCGACTSSVESAFTDVEGVGSVSVSLVMERAVILHDADKITAEQIQEMIDDRGFDAEVLASDLPDTASSAPMSDIEEEDMLGSGILGEGISTTTIHVGGMTCGACTSAVEGAFKDIPGVKSFNISLLSERAVIEHNAELLPAEKLAEIIEDTGFDAKVLETKNEPQRTVRRAGRRKSLKNDGLMTTTVAIEGMTCGACTSAVESGFKEVEGMVQFNISLLAERAVIVHDPTKLSSAKIVEIIEDRGFDAKVLSSQEEGIQTSSSSSTVQLKVYGLTGPESASTLESSLSDVPGITSAKINFNTTRASISHVPSRIGLRAIVEAIEKAGYNALVADSEDNNAQLESLAKTKEIQGWWTAFRLWLGDVVCLLLTIPVQFGIGRRFYVSAYRSLRHGSPTMDVLVVLGTSAAFFFSCAAMLVSIFTVPHSKPATTFDTSTMLITFIVLGRYLENRAKGQTSKALSRLMSLAPSTATIYADPIAAAKAAESWDADITGISEKPRTERDTSGSAVEERVVPTELIEVGDIVLVKPGDKIPADGTVTRGESYVDESMVTGEAMPVLKTKGSLLMAGTVNSAGRMDFKVTRAGRDTQLSQIVRLVQEAQTSRAPIQRMADLVAGYFVPIIITLGLSTFTAWMVLSHILPRPPQIFLNDASGGRLMVCVKLCIAVIVFACPCALGLATPTAVMVGTGVGADQGILVKGGAALETATKITHIVLDKTGTLTMGKMSVSSADIRGGWTSDAAKLRLFWTLVGLAEMGSEHPIARAIVSAAMTNSGLGTDGTLDGSVGSFEVTVGKGVSTSVEAAISPERRRYNVLVGNVTYLRSRGVSVPKSPEEGDEISPGPSRTQLSEASSSKATHAGTTIIHTAIDSIYTGSLSLADTLKPSAHAAIAALHRMDISTSIVTGDQAATALHVASLIGIPSANVHSGVLPGGKQSIVEALQKRGEIVAMVGDGINDSPALATANIGISLASGTDVAMEAADIVLMRPNNLLDIPASLHLSKTIFRRIKTNLLLSCIYNAIGLPIAMGFLLPWGITLPPLAAGIAMACSSVTVVLSSLQLKFWRRPMYMREEVLELGGKEAGFLARDSRRVTGLIRSLRERLAGRRRKVAEGERGAYVPLESYEAV